MKEMSQRFNLLAKILAAAVLVLLFPLGAQAAKITDLWVTGAVYGTEQAAGGTENVQGDAIHWWYSERTRKCYLFLPAGAELSRMRIWFKTSTDSIEAGEKTIRSGDPADFLAPGTEMILGSGSERYTLAVMQSSKVPAMFIATESGSARKIHGDKDYREKGSMVLINADGSLAYDGLLEHVKGRGNSTFAYPKKPYQIKLNESVDLYGMGKAKTWVLLANYEDNSLLRNKIAFALAQAAGLAYTSKSQAVDVYLNGDYRGSYLLCEKVEIGSARVDIADLEEATEDVNEKPLNEYPAYGVERQLSGQSKGFQIPNNPADITGGYLLELEKPHRYPPEASGFKTRKGLPVVIKEPEYASKAQAEYIASVIQAFENAIFSEDGVDPAGGKHYTELADMDSLVRKYILEEISKNLDANRTSFFLYKPAGDAGTRFFAGPVWDYDIAFGNYENERAKALKLPDGFSANKDRGMTFYWFPQLYAKPEFYEAVVKTYRESFVPAIKALLGLEVDPSGTVRSIDDYAAETEASAAMNFARWQVFNASTRPVKTGRDYGENIAYLKDFLSRRMEFLNKSWVSPK